MTYKMHANTTRSLWVAFLIGFSLMAGIDEIVFHQILAWHHFYDQSTTEVALLSDGLLHAAELLGLIAGFFLFADLRRSQHWPLNGHGPGFYTVLVAFSYLMVLLIIRFYAFTRSDMWKIFLFMILCGIFGVLFYS